MLSWVACPLHLSVAWLIAWQNFGFLALTYVFVCVCVCVRVFVIFPR